MKSNGNFDRPPGKPFAMAWQSLGFGSFAEGVEQSVPPNYVNA
jgi:hypothetical protein